MGVIDGVVPTDFETEDDKKKRCVRAVRVGSILQSCWQRRWSRYETDIFRRPTMAWHAGGRCQLMFTTANANVYGPHFGSSALHCTGLQCRADDSMESLTAMMETLFAVLDVQARLPSHDWLQALRSGASYSMRAHGTLPVVMADKGWGTA